MTTLWRVSRHRNLKGAGGLKAPGRWHERGHPVVYLAESPAGALLEACVHTSGNDVPPKYRLLEVQLTHSVEVEDLDPEALPSNWIHRVEITRQLGSRWLREGHSALLRIPSALVPATFNVILNPLHPTASDLSIQSAVQYPFDPRIKK